MANNYERKKAGNAKRNAESSYAARNIGPIPAVANPARRAAAEKSFRVFCETYFAAVFTLAWSPDHLRIIAKVEQAVISGGLSATAMPRGSGKSSITEVAVLWAVLSGRRRFVCLLASTGSMSAGMLANLRSTLESNDLLAEDYPEVCYPIRKLEGIIGRSPGQHLSGEATKITLKANKIILPTIKGSVSSGAIITATGLTSGGIRGQRHKRSDGEVARPDLAIIDDIQTHSSAFSTQQCQTREKLLCGDVLGMAGPGKSIAALLVCTVIRANDLADRLLDRKISPMWSGERCQLVYKFPTNTALWDKYGELLRDSFRAGGDGSEATEFYRQNREKMDEGSEVAWPERYNPENELSAIQHAMNLRIRDESSFWSEYQNSPKTAADETAVKVNEATIVSKIDRNRPRGVVPTNCDTLTATIDAHDKLLFYTVMAWNKDFSGCVIDYGTYPDQRRSYFTLRDSKITMAMKSPGAGPDSSLLAGLKTLFDTLLAKEYKSDDNTILRIRRCLVDSGYKPSIVQAAIRQSAYAALIMPSKGYGVTAANKPYSEYRRSKGDRVGLHYRTPAASGRELRTVNIDTNYYKSALMTGLAMPLGDKGGISLFDQKDNHRLFVEHLLAEYSIDVTARGRTVSEFRLKADRDNHWLDCTTGCLVGAAMEGISTIGQQKSTVTKPRQKVRYAGDVGEPKRMTPTPPAPVAATAPTAVQRPALRRRRRINYY